MGDSRGRRGRLCWIDLLAVLRTFEVCVRRCGFGGGAVRSPHSRCGPYGTGTADHGPLGNRLIETPRHSGGCPEHRAPARAVRDFDGAHGAPAGAGCARGRRCANVRRAPHDYVPPGGRPHRQGDLGGEFRPATGGRAEVCKPRWPNRSPCRSGSAWWPRRSRSNFAKQFRRNFRIISGGSWMS